MMHPKLVLNTCYPLIALLWLVTPLFNAQQLQTLSLSSSSSSGGSSLSSSLSYDVSNIPVDHPHHPLILENAIEESNHRIRRDTLSEEEMKALKKNPTKKPTQMIKQKPTSSIPFKSTTVTSATSSPTSSSHMDIESDHLIPSSLSTDGNTFFAPEDVTLPPNSSSTEDHHQYYNSTMLTDVSDIDKYWIDASHDLTAHEMLSDSHRRAATIQLKFPFPFYGHPIKNITIATGGFLYLGETVHSWLAATQYIAPLMANFDTSISNFSSIKYVNNETHFIVQWSHVELQDQNPPGNFSFQVTLRNNGDIIFVYKEIPFPISKIPDSKHPVKVGFSDAYVIDRTVFFIRRKTIYEYHRADLKKENINNNTAIYFTALPTCVSLSNCESCVTANIAFECKWCDATQKCSDGFDRHRQEWMMKKCDSESHSKDTPGRCKFIPTTPSPKIPSASGSNPGSAKSKTDHDGYNIHDHDSDASHASASGSKVGALFFLILIAFVGGIGMWVFYAYKNPQTGAGQFLIKYRPAEWKWNSGGDTRYTAASIHM